MNIDFAHRAGFSAYVVLLVFSGVVMLGMASPVVRTQSRLLRALNTAFGVGFVGYGLYLAFLFHGGSYVIFFKAFILPILMIFRTIRSAKTRRTPTFAPTALTYPTTPSPWDADPYSHDPYSHDPHSPVAAPPLVDGQNPYAGPQPGYAPGRHAAAPASQSPFPGGYLATPSAAQQSSPQTDFLRTVDGPPFQSLNSQVYTRPPGSARARTGLIISGLLGVALVAGIAYVLTRSTPATPSSSGPAAPTDQVSTAHATPGSLAWLNTVVLQPGELPADWTATPHTDSPHDDSSAAQMTKCVGAGSTNNDQLATAHSDDFALGTTHLTSAATSFRSRQAVQADIAALHRRNMITCTEAAVRQTFHDKIPAATIDAPIFTITFAPAGEPPNVIATITGSVTARGNGRQLTIYFAMNDIAGATVEAEVNGFALDNPVPASLMTSLTTKVATRVASG